MEHNTHRFLLFLTSSPVFYVYSDDESNSHHSNMILLTNYEMQAPISRMQEWRVSSAAFSPWKEEIPTIKSKNNYCNFFSFQSVFKVVIVLVTTTDYFCIYPGYMALSNIFHPENKGSSYHLLLLVSTIPSSLLLEKSPWLSFPRHHSLLRSRTLQKIPTLFGQKFNLIPQRGRSLLSINQPRWGTFLLQLFSNSN